MLTFESSIMMKVRIDFPVLAHSPRAPPLSLPAPFACRSSQQPLLALMSTQDRSLAVRLFVVAAQGSGLASKCPLRTNNSRAKIRLTSAEQTGKFNGCVKEAEELTGVSDLLNKKVKEWKDWTEDSTERTAGDITTYQDEVKTFEKGWVKEQPVATANAALQNLRKAVQEIHKALIAKDKAAAVTCTNSVNGHGGLESASRLLASTATSVKADFTLETKGVGWELESELLRREITDKSTSIPVILPTERFQKIADEIKASSNRVKACLTPIVAADRIHVFQILVLVVNCVLCFSLISSNFKPKPHTLVLQ